MVTRDTNITEDCGIHGCAFHLTEGLKIVESYFDRLNNFSDYHESSAHWNESDINLTKLESESIWEWSNIY